MNRIYKVIFSRRTGMYVVTSEVAKAMGKGATALGVVALSSMGLPNGAGVVQEAQAQTGCIAVTQGGVRWIGDASLATNNIATCVSSINSMSTGISSLSTRVSSLRITSI